jgi:aminopeptidase YwaD
MSTESLPDRIERHLRVLARDIGPRPPGSPANRQATTYLEIVLAGAGLPVERLPFSATVWEPGETELLLHGHGLRVESAPFSRPGEASGRVVRVGRHDDLVRRADLTGAIVVCTGDLAREPYFPKAFPFLDLPEQRATLAALEAVRPAAVIAVAPADDGFEPVFEDPDLAFPYLTVGPAIGDRLRDGAGVELRCGGRLGRGDGVNVSALRPGRGPTTVVSAHVDSKATTVGALDNAGSVAALLALAELGLPGDGSLELVFFNGEDHYAAPGEQAWLAARNLGSIGLEVNVDGAGLAGHGTRVAALAAAPALDGEVRAAVGRHVGFRLGDPWYESDHAVFAMRGIPSLALTTDAPVALAKRLAHAPGDTVDSVDPDVLASVTTFLRAELPSLVMAAGGVGVGG